MWLLQADTVNECYYFVHIVGDMKLLYLHFHMDQNSRKFQMNSCSVVCVCDPLKSEVKFFLLRSINKHFEIYVVCGLTQQVCRNAHKTNFRSENKRFTWIQCENEQTKYSLNFDLREKKSGKIISEVMFWCESAREWFR